MIRAAEYKRHAQECHEQAKRMQRPDDKDALEQLAQIWEKLADVREHHPELEPEPQTGSPEGRSKMTLSGDRSPS